MQPNHRVLVQPTLEDWINGAAYQKRRTQAPAPGPLSPKARTFRTALTLSILLGRILLCMVLFAWMQAGDRLSSFNRFASIGLVILLVALAWKILWPEPEPLLEQSEIAHLAGNQRE